MTQLTALYPEFDYSLAHTYQLLNKWQISHEHQYLFYQDLFSKITNSNYTLHSAELPDEDFFELIYLFCAIFRDSYSPFVTDNLDESEEEAYVHQTLIDFIDSLYQFSQLPLKYEVLLHNLPTKSSFSKHPLVFSHSTNLLDNVTTLYKNALKALDPSLSFSKNNLSLLCDNLIHILSIINAFPFLEEITPTLLCLFFIQYQSKLATEIIEAPSLHYIFKQKKYSFSSATTKSYNNYYTYFSLYLELCGLFQLVSDISLFSHYVFEEQTHLYSWAHTMLYLENLEVLTQTNSFDLLEEIEEAPTLESINMKMLLSSFSCFYNEQNRYALIDSYKLNLTDYEYYQFDCTYDEDVLAFLHQHPEFQTQYITYYLNP